MPWGERKNYKSNQEPAGNAARSFRWNGSRRLSRWGYLPMKIAVSQVMMPINQGAISQNDNEE
jgi:hypothetical protein